jgi:murein lipoprotein
MQYGQEALEMKKSLLALSMMFVVGTTLGGCATSKELAKVQTQQDLISAKADQALMEAQAAKASADAAAARADEATRIADEKAKKADAAFAKSMRK